MSLLIPGGLVRPGAGRRFDPGNILAINQDNPITDRLCFAWASRPISWNFVDGRKSSSSSTPLIRNSLSGVAGNFTGSNGPGWPTGYTPLDGSNDITMAAICNAPTASGIAAITGQWQNGGTQVHLIAGRNAANSNQANSLTFYGFGGSFHGVTINSSTFVDGNWHTYIGTRQGSGAAWTLYCDGASLATATDTKQTVSNSSQIAYVGGVSGLAGASCDVELVAWWNRALTPKEALEFTNDPYGIFVYPDDLMWSHMLSETAINASGKQYAISVG